MGAWRLYLQNRRPVDQRRAHIAQSAMAAVITMVLEEAAAFWALRCGMCGIYTVVLRLVLFGRLRLHCGGDKHFHS